VLEFIIIDDEEVLSKDKTVEIHLDGKPFSIRRLIEYDQFTSSKVFSKSTFSKTTDTFFLLYECNNSLVATNVSIMDRLLTKVVCHEEIIFGRMGCSLMA
jgi:hypothetical protein